ncbi:MAG: hypothetical protein ACLQFR_00790 [Streptosporangiaceae bacterium]
MEKAAVDHLQKLIDDEVKQRFPAGAIREVKVLQYGDDLVVEPGELAVRVYVDAPEDKDERDKALQRFEAANHDTIKKLRDELSARLPEARRLEFRTTDGDGGRIILNRPGGSFEARALAGTDLTPVMARLGPADLETLDTLITAGIASNRAEAVRWTIARIRERPAYEQLRARAREIEDLKAQF